MSIRIGSGGIKLGISKAISEIPFDWAAYLLTITPTNLVLTVDDDTKISGTFTINGAGQDGHEVYISTDGITYVLGQTLIGVDNTFQATGLISSTVYFFKIRAYRGTHYSDYSNIDYAITSAHPNLIAGWKFEKPDYFGSALSDYGIGSMGTSSIYYNGKTYIAYQGDNDDPYITTYTHATDAWATPVKIGTNPLINGDGHGTPSIFIDSSGFIHVMFGAHNSAIQYSKSNNSENITAWTAQASPATGTYPQFVQFSDDTIYMFYRDDNQMIEWAYKTSVDDGANWSAATQLTDNTNYITFKKGVGDTIHAVAFGHHATATERFNIYYMYFNGTDWLDYQGNTLTLPGDGHDVHILIYDSNLKEIPLATFNIDANNKPIIVFTEILNLGEYYYYVMTFNGTSWVKNSVDVKTGNWRNFSSAINYINSARIEIVVMEDTAVLGGNFYLYVSTDSGATWKNERVLLKGRFLDPVYVKDYNSNAKLLICEHAADPATWTRKIYLWGDSGIIKGSVANMGTTVSEMKGLYTGTKVNAPTSAAGVFGLGVVFASASSQYITVLDNAVFSFDVGSPDHAFSMTFWVKVANTVNAKILIAKYKDPANEMEYFIAIYSNIIKIALLQENSTNVIFATAPYLSTNWVFVCCTYDGAGLETGIKIYKDCLESQNVQTETGTYTGMVNHTAKLRIGAREVAGTEYYMDGSMDEVKIWDKVLSAPEMTALMANTI